MAAGDTFRNANILVGSALGELPLNISLAADNTQINVYRYPFLRLTSDSATSTARTFTLTNGAVDGQILHICLVGDTAKRAELAASSNVLLTDGTWSPVVNDTITLQWDALSVTWREIARTSPATLPAAGRYTPTITTGANVASAAAAVSCHYSQIGAEVSVSGQATVTCTAAADTASIFYVSLPVASNLAAVTDLAGSGARAAADGTAYSPVAVLADTSGDRAQLNFNASQTTAATVYFTFTYQVL